MFNIGPLELMVILLVALLVVGPKRLPEMGRNIGKGLRELRKTTDDMRRSIEFDLYDEDEDGTGTAAPEPPKPPKSPEEAPPPPPSGSGSAAE